MKKIFLLPTLFLLFFACSKDVESTVVTNDFEGNWTWVRSEGGIAGITTTPEQGIIRDYVFDSNTLQVSENGKKLGTPTYTLSNEKSLTLNTNQDFIKFDPATIANCKMMDKEMYSFSSKKDSLFLVDDVFDGINHIYIKKRTDGFVAATYLGVDLALCACCGGFLLNIEGVTYRTNAFPSGFTFDATKSPQKLLLKIEPTPISCSRYVKVIEAKFY